MMADSDLGPLIILSYTIDKCSYLKFGILVEFYHSPSYLSTLQVFLSVKLVAINLSHIWVHMYLTKSLDIQLCTYSPKPHTLPSPNACVQNKHCTAYYAGIMLNALLSSGPVGIIIIGSSLI